MDVVCVTIYKIMISVQTYPHTVIIRHRKENLRKCSLRGLEDRDDLDFYVYPKVFPEELKGYVLLDLNAPPLSSADADRGLLLIDGTWRYAKAMVAALQEKGLLDGTVSRSLPGHYRTAYPRCQQSCPDPDRGLASVEALYLSYLLLERPTEGFLDNYYWKESFLKSNGFGD
ncbi:hypothetical protein SCG7086_CC_00060 [Chlamydiales bacterium SCGC AG-110-P3]|nr:hypothetical protein SCG7086_CC_00060 [Chlamydiales bacterium SCGC AG-110-P3]